LAIVPTADEAFDIVYEFAREEADWDEDGPVGIYYVPRWLAVSLDTFGFHVNSTRARKRTQRQLSRYQRDPA